MVAFDLNTPLTDEDLQLLQILDEPAVKLCTEVIEELYRIIDTYGLINCIDVEDILKMPLAMKMGEDVVNTFMRQRKATTRKLRYLNVALFLSCAQRALFEHCKLMETGETKIFYYYHYSEYYTSGINALEMLNRNDANTQLICQLIEKFYDWEIEYQDLIKG